MRVLKIQRKESRRGEDTRTCTPPPQEGDTVLTSLLGRQTLFVHRFRDGSFIVSIYYSTFSITREKPSYENYMTSWCDDTQQENPANLIDNAANLETQAPGIFHKITL